MNEIVLQPPGLKAYATLVTLVVALPSVIMFAAIKMGGQRMSPSTTSILIGVLLLTCAALILAMQRRSAEIDGNKFKVASSFYTVELNAPDIGTGIEILENREQSNRKLGIRTNGISVPGYHSGWYRLAGGESTFASISVKPNIYIPTTRGFSLLLSVENPGQLKDQLSRFTSTQRK